jgi:heavy metal translocating P-type ATPase
VVVLQESEPLSRLIRRAGVWTLPEVRWAGVAVVLFAAGVAAQLAGAPAPVWWMLYLACYAAGGWEPGLAGLRALRERTLDVDLLMVVAAVAAAAIGQVFDGALLIVIFATSGAVEAVVTRRTEDSVRALLDLAPQRATRLLPDGREEEVPAAVLGNGDVVLVRPGEQVAADGTVLDGESEVDQASITGEGVPAVKGAGDVVFAGTVNGSGALRVRVDRPAAEWVIARIATMVEEASATKARTQLFVERIEQRYSVSVVVGTLALVGVPLAAGAAFEPTLLRAMTFMIVASPCAVVLATMPPLLAAIANGGRRGVLVKSAVAMEALGRCTVVAFDKTGTLTEGRPRVEEVVAVAPGVDADRVLALAAAAEHPSEHPLARAVVDEARARGVTVPACSGFRSEPGRGVRARVGSAEVVVGTPALLKGADQGAHDSAARAAVARLEDAGRTAVVVLVDGAPVGVLALHDRLRPGAADAVARLTALTGQPPVLLTGDNPTAARRVAAELGLVDVRAGLLPVEKVDAVRALQADGQRVLLVGDGVNDAPALAAADVGVALGGRGVALAVETADAVVVRDELAVLPHLVGLSRRARRVVLANLAVAGTVIVVLVTWDLVATLPLPLGVAGHEGSTVAVALNGLRLLTAGAWRRAGA